MITIKFKKGFSFLSSSSVVLSVHRQYPGVAQSINSDVNNLMTVLNMSNALPEGTVTYMYANTNMLHLLISTQTTHTCTNTLSVTQHCLLLFVSFTSILLCLHLSICSCFIVLYASLIFFHLFLAREGSSFTVSPSVCVFLAL